MRASDLQRLFYHQHLMLCDQDAAVLQYDPTEKTRKKRHGVQVVSAGAAPVPVWFRRDRHSVVNLKQRVVDHLRGMGAHPAASADGHDIAGQAAQAAERALEAQGENAHEEQLVGIIAGRDGAAGEQAGVGSSGEGLHQDAVPDEAGGPHHVDEHADIADESRAL